MSASRRRGSTGPGAFPGFHDVRADVADRAAVAAIFARERPEAVVNLAAQAGVRHSLENPHAYVETNLTGFVNVLEGCRRHRVGHLVYASTSAVYGANRTLPFSSSATTSTTRFRSTPPARRPTR